MSGGNDNLSYASEFSDGERRFIESGYTDLAALESPAQPVTTQQQPAEVQHQDVEAPVDEIDVDELTVGQDGKARDKHGRFVKSVPHHVFHAKNEKLKTVAAELQAERERFFRADERLRVLNEAVAGSDKPKDGPETEIDPANDIFGAFRQLKSKYDALERQTSEKLGKIDEATTAQRSHAAFLDDAKRFQAAQTDFGDAFTHLIEGRHKELEMLGVTDKAKREAQISSEARELVRQAQEANQSPAERFYAIAKLRGYAPKAQEQATDPTKGPAAEAIARTAAAQNASLSLKGSGGGGPGGKLSLAALADMSDAEFIQTKDTFVAKNGKAAWDALMRGG